MEYKIDWLTLTLKPENNNVQYHDMRDDNDMCPLENWCFEFLELTDYKGQFTVKSGSVQHYNIMYRYQGIDIALSSPERFHEQGLMIRFSGDGMAFYEKTMRIKYPDFSWITFLKQFFSLGLYGFTCKCTRIDLAYDDISYSRKRCLISLLNVSRALEAGEFVSAFRTNTSKAPCANINAYKDVRRNNKGEVLGETYYVGNRKSKVFLRFYDKLLESKAHNEDIDEKIKHWTRMEFEFKDCRAMSVCDSLITLSPEEFSHYMSQVTNHYIRFIIPKYSRSNYYKCETVEWWLKVVGTVEKAKLAVNKSYKNKFKSCYAWFKKTVFPSLYAILHCVTINDFLSDVRDIGREKVCFGKGSNADMIYNDYFDYRHSEKFTGISIHRLSCEDFAELLKQFDDAAFDIHMRYKAAELCRACDMDELSKETIKCKIDNLIKEYRNTNFVAVPVVNSMYDRTIDEFQNEEQLENDYPFPVFA